MVEETFPFLDENGVAKVYRSVIDLVNHQSVRNFCKKSGKNHSQDKLKSRDCSNAVLQFFQKKKKISL